MWQPLLSLSRVNSIARDSDAFSGLQSATLAIVNDQIAQKNTFDANVVIGYALRSIQLGRGDTVLDSIPFLQYNRDYVNGALAPPKSSNVNNLIAGIQEGVTFPISETFYANAFLQPEYIWNLLNEAEIAKLHLALQPEPLLPFLGFAAPIGVESFLATAYGRAVFNYGQVTRPTTDPTLARTNNFAQGGTEIGASIFNKDDNSIFNGFSIPVDYTYLYGFTGQYKTIQQVTVAINYTLPKTKYVTIGFSYTDGRNVDTFQMQNIYKLTLGVKY